MSNFHRLRGLFQTLDGQAAARLVHALGARRHPDGRQLKRCHPQVHRCGGRQARCETLIVKFSGHACMPATRVPEKIALPEGCFHFVKNS